MVCLGCSCDATNRSAPFYEKCELISGKQNSRMRKMRGCFVRKNYYSRNTLNVSTRFNEPLPQYCAAELAALQSRVHVYANASQALATIFSWLYSGNQVAYNYTCRVQFYYSRYCHGSITCWQHTSLAMQAQNVNLF